MTWEQYKTDLPVGRSGAWSVEHFTVSKHDAEFGMLRSVISSGSRGRYVPEGTYTGLFRNGNVIMSDTPDEIRDQRDPINMARGNCLINGLGLGIVAEAMLRKPEVTHVTVVDLSPDVIALVGPHLKTKYGDRLTIVQADAYDWKPPKDVFYDTVWHDIWDDLCGDNLNGMAKLHHKYGKRCGWQGSWGKELCKDARRRSDRMCKAFRPWGG